MLGVLYIGAGNEGSRVLDNYNLLFAILIHSSMATMMLTVLTCEFLVRLRLHMAWIRSEQFILFLSFIHFRCSSHGNGYFVERAFQSMVFVESVLYLCDTIGSAHNGKHLLPIISIILFRKSFTEQRKRFFSFQFQFIGSFLFSTIIYIMTCQPFELFRFNMFFAINILVTIVGQSIGLMVGAWFNVVVSSCDPQNEMREDSQLISSIRHRMELSWHQPSAFRWWCLPVLV